MKIDSTAPALIRQPWVFLGISRSAFYRLLSAGQVPPPVAIPGSERRWRRSDLIAWLEALPADRIRPQKK